jgi:protein-disulfide isomerase
MAVRRRSAAFHGIRVLLGAVGLLCLALCVVGGWVPPVTVSQTAEEKIYPYGTGPVEVLVFTDYYCHPCQGVEPYLEGALTRLLDLGAKISFVDKPIHRATPIYSIYFLYAAKKAANFDEVLRIRRLLFDITKANKVSYERELVQNIKDNQVEMVLFEVKPIFDTCKL